MKVDRLKAEGLQFSPAFRKNERMISNSEDLANSLQSSVFSLTT